MGSEHETYKQGYIDGYADGVTGFVCLTKKIIIAIVSCGAIGYIIKDAMKEKDK